MRHSEGFGFHFMDCQPQYFAHLLMCSRQETPRISVRIRKELLSLLMSSSLDQSGSHIPDQVSRAHVLSLELCLSWW